MDASAKIGERRLSMSLWRDVKNNNNYGASISIGGQVPGGSAIGGYTGSLTWTNGQGFGNSFNYTFSNQFVKDFDKDIRDPVTGFLTSMWNNTANAILGAGAYVAGLFKNEKDERQNQLDELGYSVDQNTGNVYYLDSKGNTMITTKENFIKILASEFNEDGLKMVGDKLNKIKNSKLDARIIQRFEGNQVKLVKDEMLRRIKSSGSNINSILSEENATLFQKFLGKESYNSIAEGIAVDNLQKEIRNNIQSSLANDFTLDKLSEIENKIINDGEKSKSAFENAYADFFNIKSQLASEAVDIDDGAAAVDFVGSIFTFNTARNKRGNYIEFLANQAVKHGMDPTAYLVRIINQRHFLNTNSIAQPHIRDMEYEVYERPFELFEIDYFYQMYMQKSKEKIMKEYRRNGI